jgi:glycosyltransferase involved in cell wall biosynthesis
MKIVMIGQKGLPVRKDAGGIERHVEELSTRLAVRGHDITIFARERYAPVPGAMTPEHVTIRTAPSIPTKHLDTITHAFTATWLAIFSGADVFHYHGIGPASLAWIPRVFAPFSRVVVTFHSVDRRHGKWGFFARAYLAYAEWAAIAFPHVTIAVSKTIRDYCKHVYRKDVVYIPNGATIVTSSGSDRLLRWGLLPEKYLLTVARLVPQKGIHHLIAAYGDLQTDMPLVVVGDGGGANPYADGLHTQASGDSAVIFTGFQSGEALKQLYAHAYLYVHPSEAEGLSISILEAMGAGRCVLVSDIPENVESIDHSGLSFANANVDDLREAIAELLHHPEIVRERGERARKWVRNEYDWGAITDRTVAVYKAGAV